MPRAPLIGSLIGTAVLIINGWSPLPALAAQQEPPLSSDSTRKSFDARPVPLHSTFPSARLFDDTIIVKYNETVLGTNDPKLRKAKMNDIAALFDKIPGLSGLTAFRTMPFLGVQHFRLGQNQLLNSVILLLRKHPSVQYAEYNFRVIGAQSTPPRDPNDPQWLNGYFWGLRKIGMRSAWGYQTDASSITVAVIDSGVDYDHPDLKLNMSPGSHGIDFCADPDAPTQTPMDTLGHGTKVAGVVGARGNNNYGAVGANWQVKLLALKMLCTIDHETGLPGGGLTMAISAIDAAMSIGAPIINNSWRVLPPVVDDDIQTLGDAVRRTNCEGMNVVAGCKPALFVASAGNGFYPESLNSDDSGCSNPDQLGSCGRVFPASYGAAPYNVANVISVAATTCEDDFPWCLVDKLWYNSHFGNATVHIAAPGDSIDTTTLHLEGNGYDVFGGTSASAPHVSGCAALLQARNLHLSGTLLSITDVKFLLFTGAENKFPGYIVGGRSLNCAKAMAKIPLPP